MFATRQRKRRGGADDTATPRRKEKAMSHLIEQHQDEQRVIVDRPIKAVSRPSTKGEAAGTGRAHAWRGKAEWQDDAPPSMNAAIVAMDLRIYSKMKCVCGVRMQAKAQHRRGEYRIHCTCPACGHVEIC
jgi:hypothetical protein